MSCQSLLYKFLPIKEGTFASSNITAVHRRRHFLVRTDKNLFVQMAVAVRHKVHATEDVLWEDLFIIHNPFLAVVVHVYLVIIYSATEGLARFIENIKEQAHI